MPRTFTLDEANALLPALESVLRSAMRSKKRLEELQAEVRKLGQRAFLTGGTLFKISELIKLRSETEESSQKLRDSLAEIQALGVQVKDLDMGLLDFPCRREDEVVLLCWKLGESGITHWHTQEAGFKGRKPIDEHIARSRRQPS